MKYEKKIIYPVKDRTVWLQEQDLNNPIESHCYYYQNEEELCKLMKSNKKWKCWDSKTKVVIFDEKLKNI